MSTTNSSKGIVLLPMPDLFTTPFAGSLSVNPLHVLVRLLAALLLGCAVAWIYRRADGNA